MEKKFTFSDKPLVAKLIYASVIAILCISAIVVGIVAANNRKNNTDNPGENPPLGGDSNGQDSTGDSTDAPGDNTSPDDGQNPEPNTALTYIAPAVGTVMKSHSTTVPVYSDTLGEWRVHLGLDIGTDEGADVFASADGTVSGIFSDPMLGNTVEITHTNEIKTLYSNLGEDITVSVGDTVTGGTKIGTVGDSSVSELADEPHIHFELLANNISVNPLDYISEESKSTSLGITAQGEE